MKENYIQNRINLIEKATKEKNYKPTETELQNAYGYLDYCLDCGKGIRNFEPFSHCMLGNRHKFGCSLFMRFVGLIYNIILLPFKLIIFVLIAPFYFGWIVIKKIFGVSQDD